MNRTIKRLISGLLVFSFILINIPVDVVLANYQSIVSRISIANMSIRDQVTSSIDISWTKPSVSSRPDNNASDGSVSHLPEGYNIYWRNGTEKKDYSSSYMQTAEYTGDNVQTESLEIPLDSNSIYSFYVQPYHYHTANDPEDGSYLAPYESSDIVEALNLTDITVDAESVNGGFKVTWGNPTYMGSNVFDGYKLYYVPETEDIINTSTAPSITMSVDNSDVIHNGDGTITYTFQTPDIIIGQKYSLKIEPLYEGKPLRLDGITSVTINGTTYPIAYGDKNSHEYRYEGAYVKPSLYIKEEGADNIRLYWNQISGASGIVDHIDIYEYPNDDESLENLIGTLSGSSATSINEWLLTAPDILTSYKIVITYKDGTQMETNKVYYDPAYGDFDPYSPKIIDVEENVQVPDFIMYWKAFLRKAYTEDEENQTLFQYDDLYNDQELSYKIWVTDDLNNLNNHYFDPYYLIDESATSFPTTDKVDPSTAENTLAYYTTINQYYSFENNIAELKSLEGNKIYYIKIVATRDGTFETSEPEYYSIFIPPNDEIDVNPLTMGTPPLRIAKDSNNTDVVTDKSITIEWDTVWFEVYDKETDTWHSVVGLDESGNIVFGKDALALEDQSKVLKLYSPFDTSQDLESAKVIINSFLGVSDIPTRKMDITDSNYEIFTAQYNYVEEEGGYEPYYTSIKDSDLWHEIKGTGSGTTFRYTVTTQEAPTVGELVPNTAYLIYMRTFTYDSDGNKLYAYNPSYVVGNTKDTDTPLVVDPPAQILEAVSSTDTSVTFKWKYSDVFKYTLKYSHLATDYTEGGITVTSDEILQNGKITVENDVTYIYYTVNNLFPETTYYGWLNATNGEKTSPWSAPASIQTLELANPPAPTGLGVIGVENLDIINNTQIKNYEDIGEDYIIVEWNRLYNDTLLPTSGTVADDKGYGAEILFDSNILNSYAVKFNNLDSNTKYYFRVKTRLSVIRGSDSTSEIYYSYIISMADNESFLDAKEFEVPLYGYIDDGANVLVRDSEWTSTVALITGESDGEYDGDFDPGLYPLPDTDYEIVYNNETGELEYIFRGPGLDSNGMPNNGADQRFISTVINDKIFDFSVDLSTYNGKNIDKSKIVIPYSIINALISQDVTITAKTGNMYTKFDLGIFADAIKQYNLTPNQNTKAEISFKDDTSLTLSSGDSFASTPQSVSLKLITDTRTVDITTVQEPINIQLAVDGRYETVDNNVNMYAQTNGSSYWTPVSANYNSQTNKFSCSTKNVGTFSVISKSAPTSTDSSYDSMYDDALYTVNSAISITDMTSYNPNSYITTTQFNNIVWAVANGNSSVQMNKTLSDDAYTQLGRGGLLVSGTYVTGEKGVNSMTRLYRLKTGEAVDSLPSNTASTANMTLGEFMLLLEMVILDSK